MPTFNEDLSFAAAEMLESMGDVVFINGHQMKAFINDEHFYAESGAHQSTSISVDKKNAKYFKVGDSIVMNKSLFEVKRLPKETSEDPYFTVEVLRA